MEKGFARNEKGWRVIGYYALGWDRASYEWESMPVGKGCVV